MIYTPQRIDSILKSEIAHRKALCELLKHWEYKSKDMEYSKKKELKHYIAMIDNYIDASIDVINMLNTFALEEKASNKDLRYKCEKFKRFIRNQGFNPNDLNWVSLDEI